MTLPIRHLAASCVVLLGLSAPSLAHDYGHAASRLPPETRMQTVSLALTLVEAGYGTSAQPPDSAARPPLSVLVESAFGSDDASVIAEIEGWIEQSELRASFAPLHHFGFFETLLELASAYDEDLEHAQNERHLAPELSTQLGRLHAALADRQGGR